MSPQITTISFLNIRLLVIKLGVLKMQFANKDLAKVNGLTFYRLMGSGRERF
jgi:hypothetical protein